MDLMEDMVVYIKDEQSGGYTAYYKGYESVVSQGSTKEEAFKNLQEDMSESLAMMCRSRKTMTLTKQDLAAIAHILAESQKPILEKLNALGIKTMTVSKALITSIEERAKYYRKRI